MPIKGLLRNRIGQSSTIYLFFLLILLVPIIMMWAAPMLATVGSFGVQSQNLTGVKGLIFDNLAFILIIVFGFFVILWNR